MIERTAQGGELVVPEPLDPSDTRLLRLRGQRLLPSRAEATVAGAARAVVGLQAQSWPAAVLGVRVRTRGLTASDVERARLEERSVVRSWFMRGTLHLVATEDLGWLLGLLGPGVITSGGRRRADLGLDDETYGAVVRVLEAALADGPKTRAEIDDALARRGVPIEPKSQAVIHLIQRAALEGRVCYGPTCGREQAVVLLRDWVDVGPALDADVALVELARRYLAAFAPAAPADFAKWSALPMPQCRRAFAALAGGLAEVRVWDAPAWMPRKSLETLGELERVRPVLRLLGAFDTYLLGYPDRRAFVQERHHGRIWCGGLISPVVIVDGEVTATWKAERKARETILRVSPLEPLDPARMPALDAEADDVGRFLGVPTRLEVEDPAE
jgi:hypothetical protein